MTFQNFVPGLLLSVLFLLPGGNSYGRCAPSSAYETSLEIFSCEDRDPNDPSRILGYGVILEVDVITRNRTGSPESHDWWSTDDPLPRRMKVFYDTKDRDPCASLKPGAKRKGTIRLLCCDGGEPRCDFGTAAGVYNLRK